MTHTPKIVLEHLEKILRGLNESFFFEDYEITDDYAKKLFTELLIEKYIIDPSMEQDQFFWSEEEFERILEKIIAGSIMYEMVNDGILNSYEDENTEEVFFLTEKGKKLTEELKNKKN
jgi:hypothetical protein